MTAPAKAAVDGWRRRCALLGAEDGATAVEYGLTLALVAGAVIATVSALGGSVNNLFANEALANALQNTP